MPQARVLSLVQIEKLIQIRTPDDVVAQEIRSRGLGFVPTPKTLDELQQRGAGQATLAAVRERMPTGTLEIQAQPYSQVEVDGTGRGTTDNQGRLVLADLPAGAHRLVVNKEGYRLGDFRLTLAAREYKNFSAQLDWAGGYLTVKPGGDSVTIEVDRIGRFFKEANDVPCPPGTYTVKVSSPKYKSAQKSVDVSAGQRATVTFSLEPDPGYVQSQLAGLQNLYASRNYTGVLNSAKELLPLDPKNKDVLRFLAESYFLTNEFAKFQSAANQALDNGGYMQIRLNHHHAMASGLHPVVLSISADSFSFDPQTSEGVVCNYKAFTSPATAIQHVAVTRTGSDELYLNLKTLDPKNSKRVLNFNFTDVESHFIETEKSGGGIIGYQGHQLISRSEAAQALASVENLFKRVAPNAK